MKWTKTEQKMEELKVVNAAESDKRLEAFTVKFDDFVKKHNIKVIEDPENSTGGPSATIQVYNLYLQVGSQGWSLGRYPNKEAAQKVADVIESTELSCLFPGNSSTVRIDEDEGYIFSSDLGGGK